MNLILDLGNTLVKVAEFDGNQIATVASFKWNELNQVFDNFNPKLYQGVILSSVVNHPADVDKFVKASTNPLILDHRTKLPFENLYETPETLGRDRLANAAALASVYSKQDALCVDFGTCVKFDFVNRKGQYLGGSIGPGLKMRFSALNTFTDKLPLLEQQTTDQLIGRNTNQSIISGAYRGMVAEVNGMINAYQQQYPGLVVVLTGGDTHFFENEVKSSIFADAFFTLRGLNAILNANAV